MTATLLLGFRPTVIKITVTTINNLQRSLCDCCCANCANVAIGREVAGLANETVDVSNSAVIAVILMSMVKPNHLSDSQKQARILTFLKGNTIGFYLSIRYFLLKKYK